MAGDNNSQFIHRPLLTNMSVRRGLGAAGIATQLAPLVPHNGITGSYFKRDRQRAGHVDPKRAPGESVKRMAITQGSLDSFHMVDRSIIKPVPFELVEGQAEAGLFDELNNASAEALNEIRHNHEVEVNESLWGTTQADFNNIYGAAAVQTPATKWDAAGATFFNDVKTLSDTIYKRSGYRPNTMLITNSVIGTVQGDPDNELGERIKYTRADVPKLGALASYFSAAGVRNVIVPDNLEDTANPGSNESFDFMWRGDHIGLFYIDPAQTRQKDTLASTFYWSSSRRPFLGVSTRYNEDTESYEVKVGAYWDYKEVDNFCGGVLYDVLT